MLRKIGMSGIVGLGLLLAAGTAKATPIEIYGAWHCSNDFCTWDTVRDMAQFRYQQSLDDRPGRRLTFRESGHSRFR